MNRLALMAVVTTVAALPTTVAAETADAMLQRLGADAAHHFGVGRYHLRYGNMPSPDWAGFAFGNNITIRQGNGDEYPIAVVVCHEMRHVWQYQTGFRFRPDLPYWDRPEEVDARAHQQQCAAAIVGKGPNISDVPKHNTAIDRLQQQPPAQPPAGPAPPAPPTADEDIDVLVGAAVVMALTAWWASRDSKKPGQGPGTAAPRFDFRKGFHRFALAANALMFGYLLFCAWVYLGSLGWAMLGSAGLLAMGGYYLSALASLTPDDSLLIILYSIGMYLLMATF
ncbi:hypothetical protein VSS37_03930 [Candidatus Thiothrix sp. Deng01]|uniref:DUF4157 domain-containing protein n=1 Tax=Candidatus Thiothrix phosphatis TaxID=3112415 RepID=A0ABU6CU42_9GAMM|nr:hypothetical protein [Candidatus Thiothrix sp. Deng01]MEB4590121.1 hypothetical protein [Candidatus Thiothrix sp. Deng01]